MMPDTGRLPDYLEHIQRAIQSIQTYTKDTGKPGFLRSELVQDAVIRNLEIIGEASHNIEQHLLPADTTDARL